jgi:hypothetical protein
MKKKRPSEFSVTLSHAEKISISTAKDEVLFTGSLKNALKHGFFNPFKNSNCYLRITFPGGVAVGYVFVDSISSMSSGPKQCELKFITP